MRRRHRPLWLAAGLVLLSCGDIAAPSRGDAYEWRRLVTTLSGGVDTLGFHWPSSELPVKFWAEDSLNLPAHALSAIDEWEGAFLYGEFSGTMVTDSSTADVVIRTGIAPTGGFSIPRLESTLAPECQGLTDIQLSPTGQQILRPIRVYVDPRFIPGSPGVDECMALTTTHEIGHALGIFAHSPNTEDIMYADPAVFSLSRSDRSTAELAYHTEPTLTIAPR